MKILVTGAGGLVGGSTIKFCREIGDTVIAAARRQLDIADKESVLSFLQAEKPDSVINCAAFTDVDGCETDREKNFSANADGVENLALGQPGQPSRPIADLLEHLLLALHAD